MNFSYSYAIFADVSSSNVRMVIVRVDTMRNCLHFAMIDSLLFNGILNALCKNFILFLFSSSSLTLPRPKYFNINYY